MNQDSPYDLQGTKIVYDNPWIKVHEDDIVKQDGKKGIYTYLEVPESVCIIAVNDAKEICIVESYRHPFNKWVWELPGGGGDGEVAINAAMRELEEETAITALTWTVLGRTRVYGGLSTERQANILATSLTIGEFVPEDVTRNRKFVSLDELDAMIKEGEFADNQSITALYMYRSWISR